MIHLFRQNATINGSRIYCHATKSFYVISNRNKREEIEKTQDICINEPSMKGKREDKGFNLNHTI